MDVVKVLVSERVLHLGRVRMTYRFVTGARYEYVWELCQVVVSTSRGVETKNETPTGGGLTTAVTKLLCRIKGTAHQP